MTHHTIPIAAEGPFCEIGCIIEHEGRTFESGGAYLTQDYAVGYLSSDCKSITTWKGDPLGQCRVTSSWDRTPRSYLYSRQFQVEATINGIKYTGRSAGAGMLWRGKRKRIPMTPTLLKRNVLLYHPESKFFSRDTMKVWGDTMKNFMVVDHGAYYELTRKVQPTNIMTTSFFFSKVDFSLLNASCRP